MNIKTKIIHWLGGYTHEEERKAYKEGNRDMCTQIWEKVKELNGMDAVDWCNSMWLYLELTRKECNEKYGRQE
jgi:hypothetical protein